MQPGPQSVLVLSQGATNSKFFRALPSVCGVALGDTILILLAVNGASGIVLTLPGVKTLLLSIGIAFLLYTGWITWNSESVTAYESGHSPSWSASAQVASGLSLALLNPAAIIDIFGLIGMASVTYSEHGKYLFTIACILVSWVWFLLLAIAGRLVSSVPLFQLLLNRGSAIALWANAMFLFYTLAIHPG